MDRDEEEKDQKKEKEEEVEESKEEEEEGKKEQNEVCINNSIMSYLIKHRLGGFLSNGSLLELRSTGHLNQRADVVPLQFTALENVNMNL